ncbi:ornithine cyclodeaminase family protein [Lactobacillus jensenii]|uniref:ornithine cyclodeaminase family protein n=1 Tax=Lactobacillus jensenii TaxID=109790 RepID=UPI002244D2BB|nr:ornithine cyclodeaminase family protein [Lactobacillus jensenii]MCW8081256.1 ornithine cyclodeaminase family protein [Lactobacillus jensenii]MDK6204624.1 ornithine cyclodeaminase family protein [Lactobacillus jensenii]
MLYLTKDDIQKCFSMRDVIEADKKALELYSKGKTSIPLRTNINIPEKNGQNLYMPGFVGGESAAAGIKIVSVYPDNITKGLPSVPATMIVLNPETGVVSAMLDGTYLTQLRTGAISGAATELMSNKDSSIMALIGTGGQGAAQLEAVLTVRPIKEVRIFDIDFERASKFAEDMKDHFPQVKMIPCKSAEETVTGADVITTVTTSKRSTFDANWVKNGAHINAVGAYTPEMCELPSAILPKAKTIIFDTLDGVWSESGDFLQPLEKGLIDKSIVNGDLGQLVSGEISGRITKEEISIFETVGTAALDVYVAGQIVDKAKSSSVGKEI